MKRSEKVLGLSRLSTYNATSLTVAVASTFARLSMAGGSSSVVFDTLSYSAGPLPEQWPDCVEVVTFRNENRGQKQRGT